MPAAPPGQGAAPAGVTAPTNTGCEPRRRKNPSPGGSLPHGPGKQVPAALGWALGHRAAPCGAPLAFEPGAASPGLDTNACQDALLSPQRGLLVYSRQAIAAGKKTIAEVFLIRNEVGLAALNCLV